MLHRGCRVDAKGPGDIPDRLSFLHPPSSELELLVVHSLRESEANAALPRIGAAGTGALADDVTLELSDSAEMVLIILPACVVVSAQGSEIDWKRAS